MTLASIHATESLMKTSELSDQTFYSTKDLTTSIVSQQLYTHVQTAITFRNENMAGRLSTT